MTLASFLEHAALALAFTQHLFAVAALVLCCLLYSHTRSIGWLLLGAAQLEPVIQLLIRAFQGRPLLFYRTTHVGPDGVLEISYQWSLPLFSMLTFAGCLLLYLAVVRRRQRS